MTGRHGPIQLSPEEWAKRQPPPVAELMGASWEPIATPERKLLKCRAVRLPGFEPVRTAPLALAGPPSPRMTVGPAVSEPACQISPPSRICRAAVLALGLLSSPASAHENGWYGGLESPTGIPCCNDRDCRRLDACTLPDGKQGVAANGGCWPIPFDKVLPGLSSPDGEMHGCFPNNAGKPVWICFVMPGAA